MECQPSKGSELIGLDEQKKAKLLHFYLRDHALANFDSLFSDIKDNFDELLQELTARLSDDHGLNDMDLLSLQQCLNEDKAFNFTRVLTVTIKYMPFMRLHRHYLLSQQGIP